MTILFGYFLYGSVVSVPRVRSFMVRISRSTSPTCSLAAAQLHMTFSGKNSWTGWNSISRRITRTLYEARPYRRHTLASELPNCSAVLDGMYSTVQNLIFLDTVNRKGISFTKNTSAAKVKHSWLGITLGTFSTQSVTTWSGLFLTVFPLTPGR